MSTVHRGRKAEILKQIQTFAEMEHEINLHYDTEAIYHKGQEVRFQKYEHGEIQKIKLGHKKHAMKCLENADKININEGQCVIDYMMHE